MVGHIKVNGLWLPFDAEQESDRESFIWKARVGIGPLTTLKVTDQYAAGAGLTEGRLFGRRTLFRASEELIVATWQLGPSVPRSVSASAPMGRSGRSVPSAGAARTPRTTSTARAAATSKQRSASATSRSQQHDCPLVVWTERTAPFFRSQVRGFRPGL